MVITTIGSYLTTLDEFTADWNVVNTELGGTPTTNLTLRATVTDLEVKGNNRQMAAKSRTMKTTWNVNHCCMVKSVCQLSSSQFVGMGSGS